MSEFLKVALGRRLARNEAYQAQRREECRRPGAPRAKSWKTQPREIETTTFQKCRLGAPRCKETGEPKRPPCFCDQASVFAEQRRQSRWQSSSGQGSEVEERQGLKAPRAPDRLARGTFRGGSATGAVRHEALRVITCEVSGIRKNLEPSERSLRETLPGADAQRP